MKTPGIIGTAPANATAENGSRRRSAAWPAMMPMAQAGEQRREFHAERLETEIAQAVAHHAAQDRHPEDAPRRVGVQIPSGRAEERSFSRIRAARV